MICFIFRSLLLFCFGFTLYSQGNDLERMFVVTIPLYQGEENQGFLINSERGWYQLSPLDPNLTKDLPLPAPGMVRKWRLHALLYDQTLSGMSTIQVKLDLPDRNPPVFTLPWKETPEGVSEKYSNWFENETILGATLYDTEGVSRIRLLAQDHSQGVAVVYSISLEAWDIAVLPQNSATWGQQALNESEPKNIDVARTPTFPNVRAPYSLSKSKSFLEPSKEQALQASLSFVNVILHDDLPSYYNSFSELVRLVNKGGVVDKYTIPMPASNYSQVTLSEYKNNYDYAIYTSSEVKQYFSGWSLLEKSALEDGDFLFIGTNLKNGKRDVIVDKRSFIFVVRKTRQGWKIVGVLDSF